MTRRWLFISKPLLARITTTAYLFQEGFPE